jgi:hypothetical protein
MCFRENMYNTVFKYSRESHGEIIYKYTYLNCKYFHERCNLLRYSAV